MELYIGNLKIEDRSKIHFEDSQGVPRVWYNFENKLYTLAMIDPDAPTRLRPTNAEFLHWLIVNVSASKGHTYLDNHTFSEDILMDYLPPSPPPGSGSHRYIFVIFEQPGHISPSRIERRNNFNLDEFSSRYGLRELSRVSFETKR